MRNEKLKTILYMTMHLASRKVGIAPEKVARGTLKELKNNVIFYTGDAKFCFIETKLKNRETAVSNAMKQLRIEEWILFPTYLGKRVAQVRVGRIQPEIEAAWLAVAVLQGMSDEAEIIQVTKPQQLNWYGFGLELFLSISEEE